MFVVGQVDGPAYFHLVVFAFALYVIDDAERLEDAARLYGFRVEFTRYAEFEAGRRYALLFP